MGRKQIKQPIPAGEKPAAAVKAANPIISPEEPAPRAGEILNLLPGLKVQMMHRRQVVRVGACPVLEVRVSYPSVGMGEDFPDRETFLPAVGRFNDGYREMAEGFFRWALHDPRRAAEQDFRSGGASAAYGFDRRVISWICTVDMPETGAGTGAEHGTEPGAEPGWFRLVCRASAGGRRSGEQAARETVYQWWIPAFQGAVIAENGVSVPGADRWGKFPAGHGPHMAKRRRKTAGGTIPETPAAAPTESGRNFFG